MPVDPFWLESIPVPPSPDVLGDTALAQRLSAGRQLLEERGLGQLYPGFAWTLLISSEDDQLRRIQAVYPFVDHLAVGFAEPAIDNRPPELAVIVYVNPPEDLLANGQLHESYSGTEPLVSQDVQFPVVVRICTQQLQVSLYSPSTAMLAAWTVVHRTTVAQSGWLTVFHAVGSNSASVAYDDGSLGRVVESFGECMDAVITSSNAGMPAGLASVSALDVLPQGLPLKVTDQRGVVCTSQLMDVDVNIGLIQYRKAPIRLTYDWKTSTRGDSGSLVSDVVSGQPVAMHQGASKIRDSKGHVMLDDAGNEIKRAFGLCLYQIQSSADGEFFL